MDVTRFSRWHYCRNVARWTTIGLGGVSFQQELAVAVAYVRMKFSAEAHSFQLPTSFLRAFVFLIHVGALFELFVMIILKKTMSSCNLTP